MRTIGIILAGGGSRRMELPAGGGKAAVKVAGQSLLGHVCDAVRPAVDRLVVVAAPDQPLPDVAGIDAVIHDSFPGSGPLAGIADALRAAGAGIAKAFVASCDVPLLKTEVVRLLLSCLDEPGVAWAVPWMADYPQVLVSAMRTTLLPEIEATLSAGRRDPRALIERLQPAGKEAASPLRLVRAAELEAADPHLDSFDDVDTPDDLARIATRLLYSAPWRPDTPARGERSRGDDG
jgi:molybdopterin-guanine dinucleotide biosynthesis protein A